MTTPPDAQRQPRLNRLHQLLGSDVFDRSRPDDGTCQPAFVEVIRLLDDLLRQSEKAGHRVDFIKEVGVYGKVQDITSLVGYLCRALSPESGTLSPVGPKRFNCYHDAGTGYFANGAFFTADYDGEVAFFVDDQRIYLNRHIRRAVQEAEQYVTKAAAPSTKP